MSVRASGNEAVLMANVPDTDNVKVRVAVAEAESVTRTVKVEDPAAEGVPEIAPAEESDKPAGNAPEASDHIYGPAPLTADNVAE